MQDVARPAPNADGARVRDRSSASAFGAIGGLLLMAGVAEPLQAQSGPPSPRAFATAYMAAIRSNDPTRVRALTHPATLACINPATRSFFDRMFASEVKLGATLSPGFKVASAKPVTGARMLGLLPPDAFAYPVPPTLLLEIEAEDRSHNSATLFHYLARAGDGWFTLDPCPNSRGLQLLSRRKAAGERRLVPTRQ